MSEPGHVILRLSQVESDNQLGKLNNNGRKACAIERWEGEPEISADGEWQPGQVLETGEGGFEASTMTEFSGQDRHMHKKSTETYTVLKGEFQIYVADAGPLTLRAGDEIVIRPDTIHEVVHHKRRPRNEEEDFDLLVRVHAVNCYGADDKYVQLEQGGEWCQWSLLSKEDRAHAYRKQE